MRVRTPPLARQRASSIAKTPPPVQDTINAANMKLTGRLPDKRASQPGATLFKCKVDQSDYWVAHSWSGKDEPYRR
jgi:hypothetical protein